MSGGKEYPWVDDEVISQPVRRDDGLSKPMQDYIAVMGMEERFDEIVDQIEEQEDREDEVEWESEMERDRR